MGQVTKDGYVPVLLDTWIDRFETLFRRIYGSDIDLSPKSADGEMIGILAQMFADQDEQQSIGYSMLDPNQASGVWVDQFLAYLALSRKPPMATLLTKVKIEGTPRLIIRPPYYITDLPGTVYELNSTVALDDTGVAVTSFQSVEKGQFTVLTGDELYAQTVVVGVNKITAMQTSSGGFNEELDAEAIDRAYASYGISAQNTIDGIVAEIRQMPDVIACQGYENETAAVDANGLAAHAQRIVVDGGTPAKIADVIFRRKTPGVTQVGTQHYDVMDASGTTRTMKWDQPTYVEPYITIVLARKQLFTDVPEEFVRRVLSEKIFNIGEDVSAFELGKLIQQNANFYVKTFYISRTTTVGTETILSISSNERAIIKSAKISVSVVNA